MATTFLSFGTKMKSVMESIAGIEQTFNVNSLKYKNLKIWPLIRLAIWERILTPAMTQVCQKPQSNKKIPAMTLGKEQQGLLKKYGKRDILFFSRDFEHYEKIAGKYHNIFLDPIIDLVKGRYSFLKMEIDPPTYMPRFEDTIFIRPVILPQPPTIPPLSRRDTSLRMFRRFVSNRFYRIVIFPYVKRPLKRNAPLPETESIEGFADLQQCILNFSNILLDETDFIEIIRGIKTWQAFFKEILLEIRPKMVFFEEYYYPQAMALITMCKELKIKTIEIQHGYFCGGNHMAYTHLTNMPHDGYELLPDYFWCFDQASKEDIEKWHIRDCTHYLPIMGGNVRLLKWLEKNEDLMVDDNTKAFYESLKHKDKVILLTIAEPSTPLPEHVFEAMRCSPRDWLWLIRLHPCHGSRQSKDSLVRLLRKRSIENYEIEYATYAPLYGLLKRCHHHVTLYSGTFRDAAVFNVMTTMVHPVGLEYGDVSFADTSEALLAAIRQSSPNTGTIDLSRQPEINKKYAEDALKTILGEKPAPPADLKFKEQSKAEVLCIEETSHIPERVQYPESMLQSILSLSLRNSLHKGQKELQKETLLAKAYALNQLGVSFFKREYIGDTLYNRGYKKAALNVFLKAVGMYPDFAEANNNLGVFYWQSGERDKALEYFTKALKINSNNRDIILNIIRVFKYFARYEDAKRICASYLKRNADAEELILALASETQRKQ